jgi:hypothetical protein
MLWTPDHFTQPYALQTEAAAVNCGKNQNA